MMHHALDCYDKNRPNNAKRVLHFSISILRSLVFSLIIGGMIKIECIHEDRRVWSLLWWWVWQTRIVKQENRWYINKLHQNWKTDMSVMSTFFIFFPVCFISNHSVMVLHKTSIGIKFPVFNEQPNYRIGVISLENDSHWTNQMTILTSHFVIGW